MDDTDSRRHAKNDNVKKTTNRTADADHPDNEHPWKTDHDCIKQLDTVGQLSDKYYMIDQELFLQRNRVGGGCDALCSLI